MKHILKISVLLALVAAGSRLMAQDKPEEYLGLPGDNLNLYAVMNLFRESKTLEGFERSLNDPNSRINNLDLNGDNMVDYIRVIDYVDGDVHTIVLQDAVNERENQDVAVFTVQRFANGQVQIQLTGDEELYGRNYIIEPIFDEATDGQTPNPGYIGNNGTINRRNVTVVRTTTVEMANWPLITFIYQPTYNIWVSSWRWGYWPTYWHPWRPFYWDYYYGYYNNRYPIYYGHYRRWNYHRYPRWNDFYYSDRRSHSADVSRRTEAGNYKATYSHPNQRRAGEALYVKTHPSQNQGRSDNSSGDRSVRRSGSHSTEGTKFGDTRISTKRRSTTTVTKKYVANPSSLHRKVTTRGSGKARTEVSSSRRRSNVSSKSGTTVQKDKKTKESDSTKPTRRK